MFNRFRIFLYLLLFLVGIELPYAEDSMHDPMRPPGFSGVMKQQAGQPGWRLTSTLISNDRRVAMINSRLVSVGDKVLGARVIGISSNNVSLMLDGKSFKVWLATKNLRKKPKRTN